jgi:hypothetical protein
MLPTQELWEAHSNYSRQRCPSNFGYGKEVAGEGRDKNSS